MSRFAAVAGLLVAALVAGACSSLGKDDLPVKPPPLADMEEPVALHEEPDDEAARQTLPLGSFTGVTTAESRRTLDDAAPAAPGLRVARVVENSPADAAGIEEDDLLLAVRVDGGPERELRWPSEWRKVEVDAPPGATLAVVVDRAGDERTASIRTVARIRPPERAAAERWREEKRVGAVVRTATAVEALGAGLGPGGGAVVVGLSAQSPWRAAGIRFEDLIVAVGGRPVAHPQELLEAIRAAESGSTLAVEYVRKGERFAADLPVSRREQEVREVAIPFLYSYENQRGITETSYLLGLFRMRSTAAAWECRVLWFFSISAGDADRLVETDQ